MRGSNPTSPKGGTPSGRGSTPAFLQPKSASSKRSGSSSRTAADTANDYYGAKLMNDDSEAQAMPLVTAKQVESMRDAHYSPGLNAGISETGEGYDDEEDEVIPVDDEELDQYDDESAQPSSNYHASPGRPPAGARAGGGARPTSARASPGGGRPPPAPSSGARGGAGGQGRQSPGSRGVSAKTQGRPQSAHSTTSEMDELSLLLAETPLTKLKAKDKEAQMAQKAGDLWGVVRLRQEGLGLAKVHLHLAQDANPYPLLLPSAHFKLAQAYAELGCSPQANEHCAKALDTLPQYGHSVEKVSAFKREVNVLLGEAAMQASPPKPQVALEHFLMAAEVTKPEEVKDLGLRVLVCQCCALLGDAKLAEAKATREARARLQEQVAAVEAKLEAAQGTKQSIDKAALQQKLVDLQSELAEETAFEAKLVADAETQLNLAVEALFEVIPDEESRLEEELGSRDKARKHPLVATLYRQVSEFSVKLAAVLGLKGDTKGQLRALDEVVSAHASYGTLPPPLVARVLKEQGAVLVALKRYDDALKAYNELLELQVDRYNDDTARQAIARAECFKLVGDVYVAKRQFNRAREHFDAALELFSLHLGPRSTLVLDLEHRLEQLRGYTEM